MDIDLKDAEGDVALDYLFQRGPVDTGKKLLCVYLLLQVGRCR